YAMCTGRPPFRADTSFGVLRRITDTVQRPIRELNSDTPAWLVAMIDRLLAKSPTDRFASAGEVATLLEQCLAHVQQPATVRLPEFCRVRFAHQGQSARKTTLLIAAISVIAIAIASSLFFSTSGVPTRSGIGSTATEASPAGASPAMLDW